MEIESLFSGTRWEILKALSQGNRSPMELAVSMNTTSANISQQLRLLELGGLVKSEKTSNSDKGKPRVVYSLNSELGYLILALPGFTEKKLVQLTTYHKFIMRSWFLDNSEHHLLLLELYEKLKDNMSNVELVGAVSSASSLSVYVVLKKQDANLKKLEIPKVRITFLELEEARKKQDLLVLYSTIDISNAKRGSA